MAQTRSERFAIWLVSRSVEEQRQFAEDYGPDGSLNDVLERLRTSPKPDQRSQAVILLSLSRDRRLIPAILRALRTEPDAGVRATILDRLPQFDAPTKRERTNTRIIGPLTEALRKDPDMGVRERATSSLRFLPDDPRITAALVESMGDTNEAPIVREMVAEALAYNARLSEAVPALLAALNDPHENVRFWSASALAQCADAQALPSLERLLTDHTSVFEPGVPNAEAWGTVAEAARTAIAGMQEDLLGRHMRHDGRPPTSWLRQASAGANAEARTEKGATALMFAARDGRPGIIRTLLAAGAAVNAVDNNGETALMWAVDEGCISTVRLLLQAGAAVNARSDGGLTALHWAAWGGHAEVAAALIGHGGDMTATDRWGQTPLDLAVRYEDASLRDIFDKHAPANG